MLLWQVDGMMLSHGHWDHAGGLTRAADLITGGRAVSRELPCFLHPDMFRQRAVT